MLVLIVIVSVLIGVAYYVRKRSLVPALSEEELTSLHQNFQFYASLHPASKKLFETRTAHFRKIKEFVPRNMESVTEEMKLLISACAIQLTFGYPKVFLSYFKYILVFPDQYFNSMEQRYHKGEVNPRDKVIALSWKHFVQGYAFDDGVNLGLHEMAHALRLENVIANKEYNFLNARAIKQWQNLALSEIQRIRTGESSFLRPYAGTNYQEFFAVAVEYFFEKPAEFNQVEPKLYYALVEVLNQNPLLIKD